MKAVDFLSSGSKTVPPVSIVFGDDGFLQMLVVGELITRVALEEVEKFSVDKADQAVDTIVEGSLFGQRVLVITVKKWGTLKKLVPALVVARENGDFVIFKAEALPGSKIKLVDPTLEIDCQKIRNKKTKERYARGRFESHSLKVTDDLVKMLVERTEDSAEVEAALKKIYYAVSVGRSVTVQDIEDATEDPIQRRDIVRAVLRISTARIVRELRDVEPILIITILYNTYLKLYCFLEMTRDEVEEEKIIETLDIPKRMLKEWKHAVEKYSAQAVRDLLNTLSEAFAQITGNSREDWRGNIQLKLRALKGRL
jgi:DNA polymerase III delta subunit